MRESNKLEKSIAIMQPTYLPWLGYFGLIDQVDIFIIFESVQFSKRSWQQRNKIKTASGPIWLTVPVTSKGKRGQLINEVEIDTIRNFHTTHIASLENNYRKSPYFSEYSPELFSLLENGHVYLSELTTELIEWFCKVLGITTSIKYSSKMENTGKNADLLAMLCGQVGATEYLSAPGSRDYLVDSDAFDKRNIPIKYNEYEPKEYPQLFGEFLPYMSIIDLLFNMGPESLSIIRQGYK
jgi:hypothetical protein|tara:strand:+ start:243 stop:959 length:717 start_codon:yes stop_codon:yes gene_type:complete